MRAENKDPIVLAVALALVAGSWLYYEIYLPGQEYSVFVGHQLAIMEDLNSTSARTRLREEYFDRPMNFTELCKWVGEKLTWERIRWWERMDAFKILERGKGTCGEFGVLYVAACLAHGCEARLVVATNITDPRNWVDMHVWAEVRLDDRWVHVDPGPSAEPQWDNQYMYESWSWGKEIGRSVLIYAFEDGRYEDVTSKYKRDP